MISVWFPPPERGEEMAKKTSKTGLGGPAKPPKAPAKTPDHHGQTVDVAGLALDFGSRRKGSVYDAELDALVADTKAAQDGTVVARKFADKSCKTALVLRAKKRGIPIELAVAPDGIYVRIAPKRNNTPAETVSVPEETTE